MAVSAERVVKANAGPKCSLTVPVHLGRAPGAGVQMGGPLCLFVGSHLTGNSAPQIPMMARKLLITSILKDSQREGLIIFLLSLILLGVARTQQGKVVTQGLSHKGTATRTLAHSLI